MKSTKLPSWTRQALGLAAVPGPPGAFALTETSVRYGSFPRVGSGLEYRELHEVELPAGTFGSGVLGPTMQEERSLSVGIEDVLSRLASQPTEASLVLPDSWLRIAFTEIGDLPRSSAEREEILRWKLKLLVPFRVDELRLRALEVEPLRNRSEPRRLLLAFAVESLLSHLESSFSSYGIRLGRINNVSLSLLEAVWEAAGRDGIQAVVSVDDSSYSIVFACGGSPVLYRYKPVGAGLSEEALEPMLRRELRLTRTFVDQQIGPASSARLVLFARPEEEARWKGWLEDELGCAEVRTGNELIRSGGRPIDVDAARVAPLMGAACTMVG